MECSIEFLNNPKEYYEPGQKLNAEVILNFTKTEKISKINCLILGYAKCKWNEEKGTANAGNVVTNRGYENYIKENFDLLKNFDEKHVELTAGQHKYKISYALSSTLPTSFKCSYGSIKYKICVIVDRPWKLRSNYEFPFTMIHPLNLNKHISLKTPLKEKLSKKFKMDFTSDPLLLSVAIPFSGYVPGQTINVQVNVDNQSQTHVKEVKISLKKIVVLNSTKPKRKTKQLVLAEAKVSTDAVAVQKSQIFERKVVVPSLPPNISNSDIVQVSYELRVKAKTSGFSRSPKLILPITIGTSPLVGIPNSPSCRNMLPPSYEESQREYDTGRTSNVHHNGENSFNPRYPVFEFDDDEVSVVP